MENQVAQVDGLEGELPTGKIVIVASRYNAGICDALVDGSIATLAAAGYDSDSTPVVRVPGAWELPTIVSQMINRDDVIAAIALGFVVKGETTHDEHINRAVSLALMNMGIETSIPIAFGLLTCNTMEQAIHRSGGNVGNKGIESAEAVLELLRLQHKLAQ
ncbi:MAG: 6,7-dimethyl-8-ribityllumazine synthase [Rubripirellula sp.]